MDPRAELQVVVERSLTAFMDHIQASGWWGKEREAVSFYAMGFLIKECQPGTALFDPAQVAIESRVRQVEAPDTKGEVCKDLAIWSAPGMNCWDKQGKSTRDPSLIMEWKMNRASIFPHDRDWLLAFSATRPSFTGVCVSLDMTMDRPALIASLICDGKEEAGWLSVR
jgi:hypothetical protein